MFGHPEFEWIVFGRISSWRKTENKNEFSLFSTKEREIYTHQKKYSSTIKTSLRKSPILDQSNNLESARTTKKKKNPAISSNHTPSLPFPFIFELLFKPF